MSDKKKLAVLISFSGEGGVERMVSSLIGQFCQQDIDIDVLLIKARGEHLLKLPRQAEQIKLGSDHTWLTLWSLIKYLKKERPEAMLAVKHRALLVALLAKKLARVDTRIVGRLGTHVSTALEGKNFLRKKIWFSSMRYLYPWADRLIPVAQGVADDIFNITAMDKKKLNVIRNPVITKDMLELAQTPLDHPWFQDNATTPVILGVGRFTRQKDFPCLIRAFAKVRKHRPCRLVVLGKGADQAHCLALATSLGIAQDVDFPGFDSNPFRYMLRAHLFVLSSAWEGSPNVLCEALALGTPVVSTRCPSGPNEILQEGKYGPLVPVGDEHALAQAILDTLDNPHPPELLKEAVAEYTAEKSAQHYLKALGLTKPSDKAITSSRAC